jgi:hypothetical protein
MEPAQLVAQLGCRDQLPVEAIQAARADRARMAPVFVEAVEQFAFGSDRSAAKSLFFIVHLLGEWRESSAYRPLARLMRCPAVDVDEIFAGARADTVHRVMAAVFDGDPAPLYELIRDPEADEVIRWRMLDALAMATLNGGLPHDEARRFLRSCFCDIEPQERNAVWDGWQNAVAMLGLADLKPLVKRAFVRDFVSNGFLDYAGFEENLQKAIDDPSAPLRQPRGEYALFGDTIEELSTWECFRPAGPPPEIAPPPQEGMDVPRWFPPGSAEPTVNHYRKVGRNDPCPCGSGRKFKKCCLAETLGVAYERRRRR